jgi:pilus assembly protein CpaB
MGTRKRSSIGTIGFATAALICAGFAAFMSAELIRAKGFRTEDKVQVVVAARDIPASRRIAPEDVTLVEVPESMVPASAVTTLAQLFPDGEERRVAATGILAGEMIVRARLADPARGTAMAARVRSGHRAIAITVDRSIARSRLVYPGARVDLVGTFRDLRTSVSRLLVEDVEVLSVESQLDVETYERRDEGSHEREQDTVVTVEVTPAQAEVVALMAREGKIDVVLRNGGDEDPSDTSGVSTEDLLRSEPPPLVEARADSEPAADEIAAADDPRAARRARRRQRRGGEPREERIARESSSLPSLSPSSSSSSSSIEVVRP